MDDIDQYMKKVREEREKEQQKWLLKAVDKVKDDHMLIYEMMALYVSKRFNVELQYNGQVQEVVWPIVDNFVNNVDDKSFREYLHANDGPMIRKITEVSRIFPEIAELVQDNEGFPTEVCDKNVKIIEIANKLYGLEMHPDDEMFGPEYFFALSFDFNSFTPIDISKAKELKKEKDILKKYGYDTKSIEEELEKFGLTEEQMEAL